MARQLPLSRVEQEVLRRFQEDPSGRQFLPLGDLLRNHKLIDESLELLTQGVQDHPGFAVARVVLARELFQRGLILDAWTTLDKRQARSQIMYWRRSLNLKWRFCWVMNPAPGRRCSF